MKTSDDILPGPLSEHKLREQWNQQADEHNQWESLDSDEQLAWAQVRAIARGRKAALLAESDAGDETGRILRLAKIIRDVDGNHDKGAAALAEAILSHPDIRSAWLDAEPVAANASGPSLDDLDRLCKKHEFHYEDDHSLQCLLNIVRDAILRWSGLAAPPADGEVAEPLEQRHPAPAPPAPKPIAFADREPLDSMKSCYLGWPWHQDPTIWMWVLSTPGFSAKKWLPCASHWLPLDTPFLPTRCVAASDLLPAPPALPSHIEQALIAASNALTDIAGGQASKVLTPLEWAEGREFGALEQIRSVMRQLGGGTSEPPTVPPVVKESLTTAPALPADVAELVEWLTMLRDRSTGLASSFDDNLSRIVTLLQQRHPVPPVEGEAAELVEWLNSTGELAGSADIEESKRYWRAAELLQQRHPAPVAVSERPWEHQPGWLDSDGECWWCLPEGPPYWQLANPAMVYGGWVLPASALLLPAGETSNG